MNALAKHLAAGLNVVTETRVACLTCDSGRWRLFGNDEAALGSFEVLVVAVPAAQAADLLAGQSALAEQAGRCAMSPCWVVMLGFDRPLAAPYDAAFVQGSPLSWIARNSAKPRRSPAESWVLHGGPGWSAAHIDDPPLQVIAALTHEFQQLLRCGVSVPTHTAAHRWRYALPSEPLPAGPLWDAATRLALCGDWCHGARIEGAFLSGLAAAGRVLGTVVPPADSAIPLQGTPEPRKRG
jgi:predicted NAD/FAD-dependent oxidoreductase